ncbi:MAG: HEAT repeat domain-containing protein [Anaerolineae bacterium]|nr:HEAT repeat domain-containing protein [Anaerolineae bacterium]
MSQQPDFESLIAQLSDPEPHVRWSAARRLGQLGDQRAVEPLGVVLRDDKNSDVRRNAAWALSQLGGARAVELLRAALADEREVVRKSVIRALGRLGITVDDQVQPEPESTPQPAPPAPAPQAAELEEAVEVAEEEIVFGDVAAKPAKKDESRRERTTADREDIQPSASAAQYTRTDDSTQLPHFAAYYPAAVKPAAPYALMVFVHLESARAQVEEIAKGYTAIMGGSQRSAGVTSAVKVDVGSLITFVPVIAGITFDAPERVVAWQPPYQSATFLFTTLDTLPAALTGYVQVYQGPLIIGEIPITMQVVAAGQPAATTPNKAAEMEHLQPVFASYSHRDTPVMEYFRRSYARLGQKMLVDVYDLRSGEHWADRLLDMIGESAVFQLFWSEHSAQSTYCRQEWEHALRYLDDRPRFIRPVWWQDPMPAPPPELADLHFQRVPVPVLTRLQVILAQLRRFFA